MCTFNISSFCNSFQSKGFLNQILQFIKIYFPKLQSKDILRAPQWFIFLPHNTDFCTSTRASIPPILWHLSPLVCSTSKLLLHFKLSFKANDWSIIEAPISPTLSCLDTEFSFFNFHINRLHQTLQLLSLFSHPPISSMFPQVPQSQSNKMLVCIFKLLSSNLVQTPPRSSSSQKSLSPQTSWSPQSPLSIIIHHPMYVAYPV